MKTLRERFKQEHPGQAFHGSAIFWVDARATALVVKSVFQTCAFAGYPNGSFAVRRRDGRFGRLPVDARVPGPPLGTPGARAGATSVSGRLPPEVIQRIVRQNYGVFRACYEAGLAKEPELEGLVRVAFVIGRDGKVSQSRDDGSTLPDPDVVACVVAGFRKLSFPQPEGGIVTVVYPIQFSPG
jgi:hypothetical protein